MKCLRVAICIIGVLGAVLLAPRSASANVFCPASVDALENLAMLGRENTYGLLLSVDPGNMASVRVRIDSETTAYAVDFNDLDTIGNTPTPFKRYFTLPASEHVISAWIESTGVDQVSRLACPIVQPFDLMAPASSDAAAIARRKVFQRDVRDAFSTKTHTVTPVPFGPVERRMCAQPYAPARTLVAVAAVYPSEARAVRAVGTATVRVDLDEMDSIVNAIVVRTSGYAPLDRAAREAALKSTYRTETFACRAIASSYSFVAVFNGP